MDDNHSAKAEIDRLTAAFFRLFSNENGPPMLSSIHQLFVAGGVVAKCVEREPEVLTLEAFVAPRQELLTNGTLTGFSEVETAEVTQIYGRVAQRVSFYRKRGVMNGTPFQTDGVKTFQFIETSGGWRILSLAWDDERDGFFLGPQ